MRWRLGCALLLGLLAVAVELPAPASAQASGGWGLPSFLRGGLTSFGNSLNSIGDSISGSAAVGKVRSNARKGWSNFVNQVANTTANVFDAVQEGAMKAAETVVRFVVVRSNADEVCYRILGCFSLRSPWISLQRPLPAPRDPDRISVRFYLYSRTRPDRWTITADDINLDGSGFDGAKKTFFITHGYLNSGNETWMADLKDAILGKVDGNVLIVDWGHGANEPNYLQAASNTRVVGREIALLGAGLIRDHGASAARYHFLGHSLGAHISGYAARNITGVDRVTAMDPAGPGFEALPRLVRLSKYAANFVDVLHTNAKPITALGFGMMHPIGHVDFYMNGGADQPGCTTPTIETPTSLLDIVSLPLTAVSELISCSHSRSYEYLTEAINNTDCRMWGHKQSVARNRISWARSFPSPVPEKQGECKQGRCLPVGLDTPDYPARGTFSVVTGSSSPFCLQANSNDGQSLEELRRLGYAD